MHKGKKVSLVFPAFNEAKNIGKAIEEYKSIKLIDEIIVVDNNSSDNTAQIAKKNGATVITEKNQGYGFALRKGLSYALGDYIILSEPDGTFSAKDAKNLLSYIENYDLVCGTRTNKKFIEKDANMGPFLRLGNIFVAKIIQALYKTNKLSDCGCTLRVFNRAILNKILPFFSVGGSHFLPETVILTTLFNGTVFETPVSYKKRVGQSKITGSLKRSLKVGLNMMQLIFRYKISGVN